MKKIIAILLCLFIVTGCDNKIDMNNYDLIVNKFLNKNTSLTVNEKRWVEKNKDSEIYFEIVNDYPVYAMNGQGVLFDFIEDFEKNIGLEFDKNPYQKNTGPTGTDYRIRILCAENMRFGYER